MHGPAQPFAQRLGLFAALGGQVAPLAPQQTLFEQPAQLRTEKLGSQTLEEVFLSAGAKIGEPSCAACLGGPADTFGRLNEAMSCISTTNRNFPGRMGHKQARVYLASPLTVAASAITGAITDPREYVE